MSFGEASQTATLSIWEIAASRSDTQNPAAQTPFSLLSTSYIKDIKNNHHTEGHVCNPNCGVCWAQNNDSISSSELWLHCSHAACGSTIFHSTVDMNSNVTLGFVSCQNPHKRWGGCGNAGKTLWESVFPSQQQMRLLIVSI